MKAKKLLAILAATALSAACAVPVMATPIPSTTTTGNTDVEYTVQGTDFTWSIPAKQTFTDSNVSFTAQAVTIDPASPATKILLPAGATITINVDSANGYKLWTMNGTSRVGTSEIDYDVYKDGQASAAFTTDDQVLQYVSGTSDRAGVSQGLTFATTAEKIAAATAGGVHSDKLTFTMTATGIN